MGKTTGGWQATAQKQLAQTLKIVEGTPALKSLTRAPSGWRAEVELVDDEKMTELNYKFRKKRATTDVLSFPAPPTFIQMGHLGEIVVSLPVATTQAKEHGITVEMEIQILIVHGVLHLLGLNHERSTSEARGMAAMERQILEKVVPKSWVKQVGDQCLKGLIGIKA